MFINMTPSLNPKQSIFTFIQFFQFFKKKHRPMVPSSWVGSREEGKTDGDINTAPGISLVTTTHVCLSFILPKKKKNNEK